MVGRLLLPLVLLILGTIPLGCARDRRQITPITTGTDLRNTPRGRMTPLPFPGSSLARAGRGDSAVVTAKTAAEDLDR